MHFATAPCKISGSLPEIFLIEREGRALPPITVPLLLSFCSLSFCFGVSLFILQHALRLSKNSEGFTIGGKESVKGNRQGFLSRPIKPFPKLFQKFGKRTQRGKNTFLTR